MEQQYASESEEEEEEEEPQLKYHRLIIEVLKSDMATAAYAADKFLILGTKSGNVFERINYLLSIILKRNE